LEAEEEDPDISCISLGQDVSYAATPTSAKSVTPPQRRCVELPRKLKNSSKFSMKGQMGRINNKKLRGRPRKLARTSRNAGTVTEATVADDEFTVG
jgi:hypothetical protein